MAGQPQQIIDPDAMPLAKQRLFGFEDGEDELERLRIELFLETGPRLFRYDQMLVQQVSDLDVEKAQFDISSHGLTKAFFFNRNLKAISVSAVLMDLEQEEVNEDSLVVHDQLTLFEYLYHRYLRAPQVARHKYRLELTIRDHTYVGLMTNVILGLASDDDTIGAASFTFFVVEEQYNLVENPETGRNGVSVGPALYTKETADDLEERGDIPAGSAPEGRRGARGTLGDIIEESDSGSF